jgi:hypothetical protein
VKAELANYSVTPKIVPADAEAEIVIRPRLNNCIFDDTGTYEVAFIPMEHYHYGHGKVLNVKPSRRTENGEIRITERFEDEQEHALVVERVCGRSRKRIGDFRIYSLCPDLFDRWAYKGDLHIHSHHSDGKESPGYVAGACRRIGLDFMAVTDHYRYEPSLEAQEAFKDLEIDLAILPGEEIHPPDNPVHIVNFGGRGSVNACFGTPGYRSEVADLEAKLEHLPSGVDAYLFASCLWCFDRIRRLEGLGIFCHPYWVDKNRYHVPGALTSYLFEKQPFDAFEVIGGYHKHEVESNLLQVARYYDEQRQGRRIPVVGVSDAHGCDTGKLFGWYCTIVFARSLELNELIESIKGLYSVAVEAVPGGAARVHGPFRLVKYAQFLIREFFPLHDELCREEGQLMISHLSGDPQAAERLRELKGQTGRLQAVFFSRA